MQRNRVTPFVSPAFDIMAKTLIRSQKIYLDEVTSRLTQIMHLNNGIIPPMEKESMKKNYARDLKTGHGISAPLADVHR